MTIISESISHVRADACSARCAPRYDAARPRHHALAPHRSIPELIASIEGHRARDYDRSEPIVQALIAEYQRDPDGLWTSILLVLCRPLLLAVRDEIGGDAIASDELDQLVLSSFLEAVAVIASDGRVGRTFARLHTLTRRGVMRAVTAAQLERGRTEALEPHDLRAVIDGERDTDSPHLEHTVTRPDPDESDREAQRRFLRDRAEGLLNSELIDMMTHTLVDGGRLIDWVARANPGASAAALERIYAREKRRHTRALALLRRATAPLHAALCGREATGGVSRKERCSPEQSGEFPIDPEVHCGDAQADES